MQRWDARHHRRRARGSWRRVIGAPATEGVSDLAIRLAMEPEANIVTSGRPDRLINFKYFFTRKLIFIKESDAFVLLPRRVRNDGRVLRAADSPADGQVRSASRRPDGSSGSHLLGRTGSMSSSASSPIADLIEPRDLRSAHASTSDPRPPIEEIRRFYSNYHSSRYVGEGS